MSQNLSLDTLFDSITADKVVDAEEAADMRSYVFADGVIDSKEVEFLFKVNDVVTGQDNDPAYDALFVEAISANVMADGVIDQGEVDMLIGYIGADGVVDSLEKKLLQNLKSRNGGSLPEQLEVMLAAQGG